MNDEKIPFESSCFVSEIFVVPKSTGGFRPILNLKSLNTFVEHFHFKMKGVSVLRKMVRKGDIFTKINLAIPLHLDYRKFLQFIQNGPFFQFTCLCFGLSSATAHLQKS